MEGALFLYRDDKQIDRDGQGDSMGIDAFVTSLDNVSEGLREHYVENTDLGGFVLQTNDHVADGIHLGMADTNGLKNALKGERSTVKDLKGQLSGFEAYQALGSVDEISTKLENLGSQAADADANLESIKAQLIEKHQKELAEATRVSQERYSQLVGANHDRAISELLATNSGDLIDNTGVRQYLKDQIKSMTKVDDNGNITVINPDGTPKISTRIDSADPMSLVELWGNMKNDPQYNFAMKASGASGAGQTGSSGGSANVGSPQSGADWNSMSMIDQNAYYSKNPEHAKQLAAEGARL